MLARLKASKTQLVMGKLKILATEGLSTPALEKLRPVADIICFDYGSISWKNHLATANGLIIRTRTKITDEILSISPELRWIARAGNGLDNLDLETCISRDIEVWSTPDASTESTAEHACLLTLMLARHSDQFVSSLREGRWRKGVELATEVFGKNLGIVGCGRIGQRVAHRMRAFGMNIIGYDPFVHPKEFDDLQIQSVSLEDLLNQADFISLHLPLKPDTHHFLNEERLKKCKTSAFLINAARGGLIDEAALFKLLNEGHFYGVALDVFESEPPADSYPLIHHPRVLGSPHMGARSQEAQERIDRRIAEKVLEYISSTKSGRVNEL